MVNVPWMSTTRSSRLAAFTPFAPLQLKLPSTFFSSFVDVERLHSLPISPPPVKPFEDTKMAASVSDPAVNAICDAPLPSSAAKVSRLNSPWVTPPPGMSAERSTSPDTSKWRVPSHPPWASCGGVPFPLSPVEPASLWEVSAPSVLLASAPVVFEASSPAAVSWADVAAGAAASPLAACACSGPPSSPPQAAPTNPKASATTRDATRERVFDMMVSVRREGQDHRPGDSRSPHPACSRVVTMRRIVRGVVSPGGLRSSR